MLIENGGLSDETTTARSLQHPGDASDLRASEVGTFETVQVAGSCMHSFFKLIPVLDLLDTLVGRNCSRLFGAKLDQSGLGFVDSAFSNEEVWTLRRKERANEDGEGPTPL